MNAAPFAIIAGALVVSSPVAAARVKGPSEDDVLRVLARSSLNPDQVKDIRCRTRDLGKRISMSGKATAAAQCSYRSIATDSQNTQIWQRHKLKLTYSGYPCGDEGQEADLICYSWN